MRIYGIIFCLGILVQSLYTQHIERRCGASHIPRTAQPITNQTAYNRMEIEIPIVFHILYNNEAENISDDIIFSQLDVINQDYNRRSQLSKNLPKNFSKKVATPGIRFCLAFADPVTNYNSGIIRTFVTEINIANQTKMINGERMIKNSELGGSSAWDPQKFLNVWIGARSDGITGEATFPDDPEETETDGIVLDYKVVGQQTQNDGPFNLGRTLTHEIGHYLNIFHLYGSETGCFNDDDLVDDTPKQGRAYFGQCDHDVSSCGSQDMDTNFMNFRDDNCLFFFTRGQVDRMMQTLFTTRYELISSETCNVGLPVPPDPLKFAPIVTLSNGLEIPLKTLSEHTYSLSLFDITGRVVWQRASNGNHRYQIDNSSLATNIYVLVLELDDQVFSRKVFIR